MTVADGYGSLGGSPVEDHGASLSERIRDALLRTGDERSLRRLGRAGTSVAFHVVGERDGGATLLCDRQPPEVAAGAVPAEVSVELTAEQARRYCAGELKLPALMLEGEVVCRGPARKFLAIEPILRSLLTASNVDGARRAV